MSTQAPAVQLFTEEDMVQPRLLPFVGGSVAIYSARRPHDAGTNEDAAAVVPIDDSRGVLVVADGLGGQPDGAGAARVAVECLTRSLQTLGDEAAVRGAILDALEQANHALVETGSGAATTLAALEVSTGTLRPYHVGDSAILIVGQRGRVKLQTVAHSPVGYAVEAGLLDESEALHHDDRHLISNAIGMRDMRIEVGSRAQLAPRDTALLATDGLLDNLSIDEVVEIVRSGPLELACTILAETCRARMTRSDTALPSKPDDTTFVVFRPVPLRTHRGPSASGRDGRAGRNDINGQKAKRSPRVARDDRTTDSNASSP